MLEEKNNERSHFVISANAAYGLVLSLLLGGAGAYGTFTGGFPQGAAGQCPDNTQVALSLAERNGRELGDIRNLIRDSSSLYRKESEAQAKDIAQTERDDQQDRRASLVERELDLLREKRNEP